VSIARLVVVAILVGGCSQPASGSPQNSDPPSAEASAAASFAVSSGFPVLPGAVPVRMAGDDPGLMGLWESDQPGSGAYDFYANALPAAGYPTVGLYPGGAFAVIRFRAPSGAIWQIVVRGTPEWRMAIELRLDRP
jgi:hypothetical protein